MKNSLKILTVTFALSAMIFCGGGNKQRSEVNPSQPLTVGSQNLEGLEDKMSKIMVSNSDFVTFHSYGDVKDLRERIGACETYGRPVVNTEWLRRQVGNTFEEILPEFKKHQTDNIYVQIKKYF